MNRRARRRRFAEAVAAGRSAETARAYVDGFAEGFRNGFAEGLAEGFAIGLVEGRRDERDAIRRVMAGYGAQSVEAREWLLSLTLALPPAGDIACAPNGFRQ